MEPTTYILIAAVALVVLKLLKVSFKVILIAAAIAAVYFFAPRLFAFMA